MLTVNKLIPGARGLAPVLLRRAASVELGWDVRQQNRFDTNDSQGRALAVSLPDGTVVRGGDVLVAEDGSLIRVVAAQQALLVVRHCPQHGSSFDLTRAAYHLGRRQVELELQADHLKLASDPALADLLRGMHLIVSAETSAFDPEAAAFAAVDHDHAHHEHGHAHHEHHEHHAHGNPPTPSAPSARQPLSIPIQAAPAPHVHGPGCDHGDHHHH